mgnify:CR=1 FL=1
MYRFDPRRYTITFHAPNSPNPHGTSFDYWGYHFATDATSGRTYQVRMGTGGAFEIHPLLEQTVRERTEKVNQLEWQVLQDQFARNRVEVVEASGAFCDPQTLLCQTAIIL